jgi:hypothetical protein
MHGEYGNEEYYGHGQADQRHERANQHGKTAQ